jgi:hypothetical protein
MGIFYEIAVVYNEKLYCFKSTYIVENNAIENCSQAWGLYQTASPVYRPNMFIYRVIQSSSIMLKGIAEII